jgi:phosphate acetyltransferase
LIWYKAVQRATGATAIGPILQGLKKPVNDLSRGCTVEDVINTIVITAIQAQTFPSYEFPSYEFPSYEFPSYEFPS